MSNHSQLPSLLLLVLGAGCAPSRNPSPPAAGAVAPRAVARLPAAPPTSATAAPIASLDPLAATHAERDRAAALARAALDDAGLEQVSIHVGIEPVRTERDGRASWRFGAMIGDAWAGWVNVDLDGARVMIEHLDQEWTPARWWQVRQRAGELEKRLGELPFVQRYCRRVAAQGARCSFWIEAAPAPACSTGAIECFWRAYVGASNGVVSSRFVTLLLGEAPVGPVLVLDIDGSKPVPVDLWRPPAAR